MENVKIDIYISDLLYRYDCVVVPDFGGFVSNYASAKIHAIQHEFIPPSKQISFNKNLKSNDGLLSSHIAERRSIGYEDANLIIQSFVNQSLIGLQKGDKIHIEKVGTLFLDPERNLQFTAEERNDYLLDSFGLTAFKALPIQREGAEERIQERIKEALPLLKEEEKKKRRFYWPAAAFLLIFFLSSLFLNQQYNWINTKEMNYSSFGFNSAETKYSSKSANNLYLLDKELEPSTVLNIEEGIFNYTTVEGEETELYVDNRSEETKSEIDNTQVVKLLSNKKLRFHVMGGCFSKLSNAEGLVKSLKALGFEAQLLGTYKNLHAVSFGSFAKREDAIDLLADVKNSENPNAWLLVKPF